MLHGVQLWVALPDSDRDTGRDFAHYVPAAISLPGAVARVFLGELAGSRSPVHTFTLVRYRQLWEDADECFGAVRGYQGLVTRLPAPPLPTARLRPRPPAQQKEDT